MAMRDENGTFNTALLDYVRQGSVELMQAFLRNNTPNLIDREGKTLLHHAAESNNVSMTRHFINNNHDIDIVDNHGNSPLMLAVDRDSYDTAILLVQAGANIYLCSDDAASILSNKPNYEAEHLDLHKYHELVKSIIKRLQKDYHDNEQQLFEYLQDFGCSLVQIMCLRNANLTRLMISENYCSVDERDLLTNGTALHEALKLGNFDNVKVLLEFGASVDALDSNQYPPLYYLFDKQSDSREDEEERVDIMKILIERGALSCQSPNAYETPTEFILEHGGLRAITALMQYDVDFNCYRALYSLVSNANDDALEVLRGKDIDANAHEKFSLICHAVILGSLTKVQFLLEHGVDPNTAKVGGEETPLIIAFTELRFSQYPQAKFLAMIRLLLQYGADVQYSYDTEQQTVFDHANNNAKVLETVIAHLALIEDCGVRITEFIRRKIDSQGIYKYHFQICKKQIEEMKKTRVNGSVTMFELLTESHLNINRYARDSEFTAKFEDTMKDAWWLDPYYSILLRKRVGGVIQEAKLEGEAVECCCNEQDFPLPFTKLH